MAALDEIGRAILLSLTPAQLRALMRRLDEVAARAITATERGIARDIANAIRIRED